jgi:hypothetical protein
MHMAADTLSRPDESELKTDDTPEVALIPEELFAKATTIKIPSLTDRIRLAQEKHHILMKQWS